MAKQKGIIKIEGTIGDITFYRTRDGYLVREKGGVDGRRIASDPSYQRTRENNAEFGRAGKAGKMLRTAFRSLLLNRADGRMVSRLSRQMLWVIQSDQVSLRGERHIGEGELKLLSGFDFNNRGLLSTTFFGSYNVGIDRSSGEMSVDVNPFIPINTITAPSGSTHFKIISGAAEIDFAGETYNVASSETPFMPLDGIETTAINHVHALTADTELALAVVLGIDFYQEVNGEYYSLQNGAFNPLSLVEIENAV